MIYRPPRDDYDHEEWSAQPLPSITVHEPEAVDTGLLDASGTPIIRQPFHHPIGFALGLDDRSETR